MEFITEVRWTVNKKFTESLRARALNALELAGEFVEGQAKLLCPVDTGNLRGSIIHRVNEGDLSVVIGTPVEYAPYIEFGTGEKAENGQGRKGGWFYQDPEGKGHFTYGNKPQPFLRPAVLNNKEAIKKILTTALRTNVKEI